MTEDLLIKEKGFRQMNRELEQKAQELMKKIDNVINNYNSGPDYNSRKYNSHFIKEKIEILENENTIQRNNDTQVSIKRNASLPYLFDEASTLKSKPEIQRDEVPKRGNLANKTIVNLLQTKVEMLQKELQTLRVEYKKKCDTCKDMESEHKKLETKLQNDTESLKDTITKLENINANLQSQSQALIIENSNMKKDLDKLQKEVKALNQQSKNYNIRLNRSLENNEKLKNALKCSEIEEKELRNHVRKLQEDKRLTVNNLGKQLSDLVQVFKKQILIIDNLKKQNACLIAIGQLKFTKDDFTKLLDQKPECL